MSRIRTSLAWMGAWVLLATGGGGRGEDLVQQTVLAGESVGAIQRIASARQASRDGRWADAIGEYQALQEEIGDRLVLLAALERGGQPLSDQPLVSVPVRWICQRDLAALPAEGLKLYRSRVDAQARKWLDQGQAGRDPVPLRRIVDEALASRVGDQALDLLGDMAHERGQFAEAVRWWRLAVGPLREGQAVFSRVFPDPQLDVAGVQAKMILARALTGETPRRLQSDRDAFRSRHALASGSFAGQRGRYVEILDRLLADPATLRGPTESPGWTTFGGVPERNGPVRDEVVTRLEKMIRHGPAARLHVEQTRLIEEEVLLPRDTVASVPDLAQSLPFHPLVVGRRVLVADSLRVLAVDPIENRIEVWFDLARLDGKIAATAKLAPDSRTTLTVAGDAVYARLGRTTIEPNQEGNTWLVCLALEAERGQRLRWAIKADDTGGKTVAFEGTPVVDGGRLHVGTTSFQGGRIVSSVRCYATRSAGPNGPALLWEQELCQTVPPRTGGSRSRHHLLTRAGPLVVACTQTGAVVALEAATGRRAWAVRYPRASPPLPAWPRDLAPPVYAQGLLFVAPADSDSLLAIDPLSGQVAWKRDRWDVVHLLGVTSGQLIFATPRSLRGVDAATGEERLGWLQPADGSEIWPFGRGLILGQLVLWPMHDQQSPRVLALNAEDGEPPDALPPDRFRRVLPGHLAYADGILAVARHAVVDIYVDPTRWPAAGQVDARLPDQEVEELHVSLPRQPGGTPGAPKAGEWALPAKSWQVDLDPDERLLVPDRPQDGDPLLLARREHLIARDPTHGGERWAVSLPFTASWASHVGDHWLAAGRDGIAGLEVGAKSAEVAWTWLATKGELSGWQLAGAKLICFRDDRRRMSAFDVGRGKLLWDCWAPAGRLALPSPAGRFQPAFVTAERWLVVQTSGGRTWVVDPDSGQVRHDLPTTKSPWPTKPVVSDGQVIVVESQSVAAIDPVTGHEVWRWRPTLATTLSGEPLQAISSGQGLFLAIPRNFGLTLQRLDLATGREAWPIDKSAGPQPLASDGLALCGQAALVLQRGALNAFAIEDGRLLWSFPLPGLANPWRVLVHQGRVLVYSAKATARRWEIGVPFLTGSFHLPAPSLAVEEEMRAFWIDGSTGRPVQRLYLERGKVQSRFGITPALTSLVDSRAEFLDVQVMVLGKDLFLSRQGRLWGRTP